MIYDASGRVTEPLRRRLLRASFCLHSSRVFQVLSNEPQERTRQHNTYVCLGGGASGCERVSSSRLRFDGQGGGLKQRKWRWEGAGCRTALGRSAGKKAAVRAYRCGRRTPWQLGSPPLPFAHRGGKNKFWGLGRRPLSGAKSDNWWGESVIRGA